MGKPPPRDLNDRLKEGDLEPGFYEENATLEPLTRLEDSRKPADVVPQIVLSTDVLDVCDQAVAALADDPASDLYSQAGQLVRVNKDHQAEIHAAALAGPKVEPLPVHSLWERMTASAQWVGFKNGKPVEAKPPLCYAKTVRARGQWKGIRPLTGVVPGPALRPDWSLLSRQGYDVDTGLYVWSEMPGLSVPPLPSFADAKQAAEELLDVVCDFPFESDVHRAAWLSGVLTPASRTVFVGPAPLILIDGNVRGSGKSLLADLIGLINTGEPIPRGVDSGRAEEQQKLITSLMLGNESMFLFDNIHRDFGGAAIDAALTAPTWKDRVLGESRMVEGPLRTTIFGTGNNVRLRGDLVRRVVHIRLSSSEEKPELRTDFKHPNLLEHVRSIRARLLSCVLTTVRAYHCAGKPKQDLSGWGSYEGWSNVVRAPIVWLGYPDPAETRTGLEEAASTTEATVGALVANWPETDDGFLTLTSREVEQRLEAKDESEAPWRAAVLELCSSSRGGPNARSIGRAFGRYRDRNFASRRLVASKDRQRMSRWTVELLRTGDSC